MNRRIYEKAGRRAETMSVLYLWMRGYKILVRRFKCQAGEIDIIAQKGADLVIIEVKQRATLAAAQDALTPQNLRRVSRAADIFVARNVKVQNLAIRFDAIFVIGAWKLRHLEDAWRDY
jgi:putative endonuclease